MKNRAATWINFIFATIVVIGVPLRLFGLKGGAEASTPGPPPPA